MSKGNTTGKIRLIIVENDEDEREFMQAGFESSGKFQILAMVKNGDQLFHWLNNGEGKPQVILSDLNMPGKNGYDIIEHMRGEGGNIPVIITSTSTTRSIINKCMEMGAAEYIVKPDTFVEYEPFAQRLYTLITEKNIVRG